MKFSKFELKRKIKCAHEIAKGCVKEYGGSIYPFLAGAYQGIFCELLDISNFDEFLKDLSERKNDC